MVAFLSSLGSVSLRINPAYAAALALVAIQVSVGILFKAAQTDGKYTFSASSSVTISEFFKLLLATFFYYRECAQRSAADPGLPVRRAAEAQSQNDEEKGKDSGEASINTEDGEDQAFLKRAEKVAGSIGRFKTGFMPIDLKTFYGYVMDDLPAETWYGFAFLALFYMLINNTIFLQFKLSDPGTIQLIKSGTTLITAVVSIFLLGSKVSSGQWLAIALQVCGIVTTQYRPGGATNPFSTYLVLLFAMTISAVSSVYNQKLCKSVDASMHVMNISLYSAGTVINLLLHIVTKIIKRDEPGFFTGYGNIGAILVIISNVCIGLAMTAVYKYADAIIKCFATAISTAILLYISPILFHVDMSFLIFPGTSVVFIATWLYMEATPKASAPPQQAARSQGSTLSNRSTVGKVLWMIGPEGPMRRVGLSTAAFVTLVVISMLIRWEASHTAMKADHRAGVAEAEQNRTNFLQGNIVQSPFRKTMAYVRYNSKHKDRIPLINNGYGPFFQSVHTSMPHIVEDDPQFVNLTHDACQSGEYPYAATANTMRYILNSTAEDEVTGLLYYHFDMWVDPMAFAEMDFNKIWFADSTEPKFLCMKSIERYREWWAWGIGVHEKAVQAAKIVASLHKKYAVDPTEWCSGWSDIYYIPRRFFSDYIELTDVFIAIPVFHEVALPTIMHIIDKTCEHRPSRSVITRLADCWGNCCTSGPGIEDIFWRRCGHRLDLQDDVVRNAHFRRLRQHSMMLGSPVNSTVHRTHGREKEGGHGDVDLEY